jgi:amino acid transporter
MAGFFSKSRDDEKRNESPTQELPAAEYSGEEGIVDDVEDDLHRGMKPRQLSMCNVLRTATN